MFYVKKVIESVITLLLHSYYIVITRQKVLLYIIHAIKVPVKNILSKKKFQFF